jgi:ABC-type antimicrobial peptide transport system permease subunit
MLIVVGVVKGAIALVASGLLIGVFAATVLTRALIAALDFVEPPGAVTFGAVAMILLGVAAAAVFAPARKAMRVDPMQTLRAR